MNYRIVTAKDEYDLAEKVQARFAEGWRPQGGVEVVFYSAYKEMWAQAMVKEQ